MNQITHQYAIVVSEFNKIITEELLSGALTRLAELNISKPAVKVVSVPGAVEIPLTAQYLANSGKYQAIICLGCVIQGETDHYDYVCQQVSWGCQQVMLSTGLPIIFGILTTQNVEQALARCGGEKGHKGRESVDAAVQMVSLLETLR